jgi:CheY-like chemotaxis protein
MSRPAKRIGPRILVVDDERIIADTLAMVFDLRGFAATAVYSDEQAVDLAKSVCFDAVVSDVMMPGISGIAMAVEIAKMNPRIAIILTSGNNAASELLQEARSRGYNFEIYAKPVQPTVIIDRLNQLLK